VIVPPCSGDTCALADLAAHREQRTRKVFPGPATGPGSMNYAAPLIGVHHLTHTLLLLSLTHRLLHALFVDASQ
jgi:hypothetical protein